MISNFKEKPEGGYYCSECHMSFGDLQTTCPYCGSIVSNYEELITKQEQPDIIIGGRWWEEYYPDGDDYTDDELDYKKLIEIVKKVQELENEGNVC